MASQGSQSQGRFPMLLVLGLLMAVAVIIVAFVVDSEIGIPVLILAVICAIAAIGFRVIASRGSDSDSSDNAPKQPADDSRPLGDTEEAHDEISPHDLPLEHPGRHEAEEASGSAEGTTQGPLP